MNSIRTNPPDRLAMPKWPFYLLDAVLVAAGTALVALGPRPLGAGLAVLATICVLSGALASILPHWRHVRVEATVSEPDAAGADSAPPLAEMGLLAWRIRQRAEQAPETHRSIVRNARRLTEVLGALGVEIISYAGRKLDAGSRVQILEAVPGEENRVLEESEPEIQVRGRLVRQAIVTVGRGNAQAAGEPNQTR